MRQRHFPRLCRSCRAPMARQEDTCWRCGIEWASEVRPRNALRVVRSADTGVCGATLAVTLADRAGNAVAAGEAPVTRLVTLDFFGRNALAVRAAWFLTDSAVGV